MTPEEIDAVNDPDTARSIIRTGCGGGDEDDLQAASDPIRTPPIGAVIRKQFMNGNEGLSGFLYDAFISYATDPDYLLVRELEIFLETFATRPRRLGSSCDHSASALMGPTLHSQRISLPRTLAWSSLPSSRPTWLLLVTCWS